jgi:uncharacterized protein YutE (UPF0331/DUF86 family)
MNPAFNGIVQRKLSLLDNQVAKLEQHLRDVTETQFAADWVLRSMAERALQVAAEIMIDVAERVLAIRCAGPAATAAEAVERLARLGMLSGHSGRRAT